MGKTTRVIVFIASYLTTIVVLAFISAILVENDYYEGSGLLKKFMHEHSISVMVTITAIYLSLAFIMLGNSPANHDKKIGKASLSQNFEWVVTVQGIIMVLLPILQLKLLSETSAQEMPECSQNTANLPCIMSSNLELKTFNFLFNITSLYFLVAAGLITTLISKYQKKEGKK